jgi:uncharacterized membrane protein
MFKTAFKSARHLSLSWARASVQIRGSCKHFLDICFYDDELLAFRPTSKMEDRPLSAVRDCLYNIFAATLRIGGRFSIRNLRKRLAVVRGKHTYQGLILWLSWKIWQLHSTKPAHFLVNHPLNAIIVWCTCYILSSIILLTPKGQFLQCATIAFSGRYYLFYVMFSV